MVREALNIAVATLIATQLLIASAKSRKKARAAARLVDVSLLVVAAGLPLAYFLGLVFGELAVREVQGFFYGLLAGTAATLVLSAVPTKRATEAGE